MLCSNWHTGKLWQSYYFQFVNRLKSKTASSKLRLSYIRIKHGEVTGMKDAEVCISHCEYFLSFPEQCGSWNMSLIAVSSWENLNLIWLKQLLLLMGDIFKLLGANMNGMSITFWMWRTAVNQASGVCLKQKRGAVGWKNGLIFHRIVLNCGSTLLSIVGGARWDLQNQTCSSEDVKMIIID